MKGKTWIAWLLTLCLLAMSGAALADAQWAEENGLNKTETVEELYQAALAEGGVLNLYGCTGRDETVGKSFEEAYPGITVNFYDLGINEMLEKFTREYEAGIYTADPEKDPTATKFQEISYDEVYTRGLKVMDLTATALCKENGLPIVVFDMDTPGNLAKVLAGENIGTLVY